MSYEKMILTPYEPTRVLNDYSSNDQPSRVLNDYSSNDQQNDRMSTASYEDGDVNSSELSKNNTLSQNDKPRCQFCSKVYANKFSLNRHVHQIHKKAKAKAMKDDDEEVGNLSSTSSDHTNVSEDNHNSKSGSNTRDSSMSTSSSDDDDDDDDNDASPENFSNSELLAWMTVLKHSPVLDELYENDKIQNIDDLYRRENIRKCLYAAANTVMRYKKTMKALRRGRLYPAIRYEMKRLAKHRYGKRGFEWHG